MTTLNLTYKTLLIIDDDVDLVFLIANRLKKSFHIIKAHSIKEAESAMNRIIPDAILLDHNLPDGVGTDLLKKIKSSSDIPVIMMTANHDEQVEEMAQSLGVNGFIFKPFEIKLLESLIHLACSKPLPTA